MNQELSMSANQLVAALQKPASEFTKADIISYIKENDIRMVNFMYPAADGRLKTLNFVINDAAYLDAILTCGERVDGSSLFSFIEAGSSDLYVVPRFSTAFIDPFAETTTLSMLCSYFNKDGELLESSPEYTLRKACQAFTDVTGMEFQAMGELSASSRLPTSVVIMNRLLMPSSMISARTACCISRKPADKLSTAIPKWVTSRSMAKSMSRMKSNSCRYVPIVLPTS